MSMRPTLKDVALKAKVSLSTASLVLNGRADQVGIALKTRHKVEKVAAELGYRGNFFASCISRRESPKLIMLCLQEYKGLHSSVTAEVFANVVASRGHKVILQMLSSEEMLQLPGDEMVDGKTLAGIAMVNWEHNGAFRKVIDKLQRFGLGVALLENRERYEGVMQVATDEYAGGRLAAEHLLEQGIDSAVCLSGWRELPPFVERLKGFSDTLKSQGLRRIRSSFVDKFVDWEESGWQWGKKLKPLLQKRTGVFVAGGGVQTLAAMRGMHEAGIVVGRDCILVGYHGGKVARLSTPSLTTVDPPIEETIEEAANMLIDRLEGSRTAAEPRIFTPELKIRESSAWI